MTELKRMFRCAQCGKEASFYVSSDIPLFEVMVAGRCECGTALQLNYSVAELQQKPNPEVPSDALKDIIEG